MAENPPNGQFKFDMLERSSDDVYMIAIDLCSPMRDWRPGEYPVSPIVRITAKDDTGRSLQSADLATEVEIDTFLNRIVFEFRLRPMTVANAREMAGRELALQQARMLRRV